MKVEKSFESGAFYNRQTQDTVHLKSFLKFLKINNSMKILDLGTGTGYLAFSIAEKFQEVEVI